MCGSWQPAITPPTSKVCQASSCLPVLCKLMLVLKQLLWETLGIHAHWAHNKVLCWPIGGIGPKRALIWLPAPAGKTLTKQLMTAVESALQDRFGSHAGWAHNTLFISELASQRHVLPARLHPGSRGKASRKGSTPVADADAEAELSEPITPPQLLGRGQRGAARRSSAAVEPKSKHEAEEPGTPHLCSHGHPSSAGDAAGILKEEPSDERSNMGEGREGSKAAIDILNETYKVKTEGSEPSARVTELVEGAAMEAFKEARPADLSPKTPLAEGDGTGEQQVAPKGKKRSRKAPRTD